MTRRETAQAKRLSPEEIQGITRARNNGVISDKLTEELMGVQFGKYRSTLRRLSGAMRFMFGRAEIFNRETTYITAFRIAKKKGMNFEQAAEFAERIIDETHFVYGRSNLPPFARGGNISKIARAGYTFRSFTHNLLSLYRALGTQYGVKGKYALAKGFAALLVFAGVSGIPLYKNILSLIQRFTGENISSEIVERTGKWSKYLLYGAPAAIDIDLTGSISIEVPTGLKEVPGVPYEWLKRSKQMIEDIQAGDVYRAAEDIPVMPQAVRLPMQAVRYATRGQETRSGKPITDDDFEQVKLTTSEAIKKTLGFQPLRLSEGYRKYEARRKTMDYWKDKAEILRRRYLNAYRKGEDSDALAAVEVDIDKFNDKRPDFISPLRPGDILKRLTPRPGRRERLLRETVQ